VNAKATSNLGLLVATLTFAVAFLADVIDSKRLFKAKNVLLFLAAPVAPILSYLLYAKILQLEALITILYWPIHFYDRTLLVDPKVAPQLPLLIDLGFHFIPTLLLMIDTLFLSPPWETHALAALMSFSVVAGGYWIWVEECFSKNNFYPYPLMGLMNREQRLMLFAFATLLCWSSFLTVRGLYRMVNGEIQARRESGKKNL